MDIFKVCVMLENGSLAACDGIEFESRKWIVSSWIDNHATRESSPLRLIRFDSLDHQEIVEPPEGHPDYQYLVNIPIPTCIFEGQPEKQTGTVFEIYEAPDIRLPMKGGDVH